jgi:hypothetical protein
VNEQLDNEQWSKTILVLPQIPLMGHNYILLHKLSGMSTPSKEWTQREMSLMLPK